MKLPDQVKDIIRRFVAKYPLWQMEQGPEAEERARQWSTQLAQQIAYDMPRQGWGKKRADPGRPISKDAIAQLGEHMQPPQSGKLFCWDILTGAGTGKPGLVNDPDSIDITGQVFVPVDMVDHLREPETGPEPQPEPEPEPEPEPAMVDLKPVLHRLEAIEHHLNQLVQWHEEQVTPPVTTFPNYHADGDLQLPTYLGGTRKFGVTLTPVWPNIGRTQPKKPGK